MSDERFVSACWCSVLVVITLIIAALDVYKSEHICRCMEKCPCQMK